MSNQENENLKDIFELSSDYINDDGFSEIIFQRVKRAQLVRRIVLSLAVLLAVFSTFVTLNFYNIEITQLLFTEMKLAFLPRLGVFWGILLSCFVVLRTEGAFEK